jgi:hypothetical protein
MGTPPEKQILAPVLMLQDRGFLVFSFLDS